MNRILAILVILMVSVMTTACINNLAIQELNNKAKAYMEAGETDKAICRYKSSLDLDDSVFETNYNLGVAYVTAKQYDEAIDALKNAIKIDSNMADSYYSLAVALENKAYEKIRGEETEEKTGEEAQTAEYAEEQQVKPKEYTAEQKEVISKLLMDAIENYNKYLSLNPAAEDKEKVSSGVESLNKELLKYSGDSEPAEDKD